MLPPLDRVMSARPSWLFLNDKSFYKGCLLVQKILDLSRTLTVFSVNSRKSVLQYNMSTISVVKVFKLTKWTKFYLDIFNCCLSFFFFHGQMGIQDKFIKRQFKYNCIVVCSLKKKRMGDQGWLDIRSGWCRVNFGVIIFKCCHKTECFPFWPTLVQ